MKRIRAMWQSLWVDVDRRVRLGRILGLTFMTAGVVLIFFGWWGAAGVNLRVDSQFPYLISGGIMGLALVIVGATMLFLSIARAERQVLTEKFDEMAQLLSRNLGRMQIHSNGSAGSTEQVVAASGAYHLANCRLLEGKQGLMTITVDQAAAEGLDACRVCSPPEVPKKEKDKATEPVTEASGTPAP